MFKINKEIVDEGKIIYEEMGTLIDCTFEELLLKNRNYNKLSCAKVLCYIFYQYHEDNIKCDDGLSLIINMSIKLEKLGNDSKDYTKINLSGGNIAQIIADTFSIEDMSNYGI